jgi:TonB family protein
MKSPIILFIYVVFILIGCGGKMYHPSEYTKMKILASPLCVGNDSLIPPDTNTSSSDFIPTEFYPELIREQIPQYPAQWAQKRIYAKVLVWAYVDTTGSVLTACVTRCSNPGMGFEEAAVNAALKCKYKPMVVSGKPYGRWIKYPVIFEPDI